MKGLAILEGGGDGVVLVPERGEEVVKREVELVAGPPPIFAVTIQQVRIRSFVHVCCNLLNGSVVLLQS